MSVSGSLGSLLQGVSQQPAHIRNDGQLTAQTNMVSDVVRGLTARPATELRGTNETATAAMSFVDVTIEGDKYQIGFKTGILEMLDNDGNSMTVNPATDTLDYIGTDMQPYVYDNDIYLVNRDMVVAMDTDKTDAIAEVKQNVGLVQVLSGKFEHTYEINLEYDDGTVATGTFLVPDGNTTGDAAKATANYIANQLKISLAAHGNIKGDTVVAVSGPVVYISGDPIDEPYKITTEDGSSGLAIRSSTDIIEDLEDLAKFAPHGALVQVIGGDGNADDIWMRFEVTGDPTVGTSFGSEGLWREWHNPNDVHAFDLETMPHVLTKTGTDTFALNKGVWQERRVGDENSNAQPGFVGYAIRDIGGFQSRLVFCAGTHVAMSRTNIATDFWKQSATVTVDTDPIDMTSTSEDESVLQWIMPFDRDLVIFGDRAQFLVTGSVAIAPATASLVQTTNFEMGNETKPVSTGRTLLFAFQNGGYGGVKEFFSANSIDASEAISITKTQDEYMPGNITNMYSNTNFSVMLCRTDDAAESKTIFVHQYYWDGEKKAQAAWFKWIFPYDIAHVYFSGSSVYVLMYDSDLGYIQTNLDLDLPDHPSTDYHVTLDLREDKTTTAHSDGVSSYVDLPYDSSAALVQGSGCAVPGQALLSVTVEDLGSGVWRHKIPLASAPAGEQVIVGLPYAKSFKPTMPFIRDRDGKIIQNSKLVLSAFIIYFEQSGDITATKSSKYRAVDTVIDNSRLIVSNDPDDPDANGVRSGEFTVPWGDRSDWSELEISSNDVRPLTVINLEWEGQALSTGRRL